MSKKNQVLDKVESMSTPNKKVYTKEELSKMTSKQIEEVLGIKPAPGRPVNPDSERQKRLATKGIGTGKRGRPANPESENYKKKQEMEARKATPGYVAQRGRQVDPTSKRQVELAEKDNRKKTRLLSALPELIEVEVTDEVAA